MILISTGRDSRFDAMRERSSGGRSEIAMMTAPALVRSTWVGDVGDRSEHADSVVAQMPLGRVVVEDADSDEFVVRVLSDHIEGEHALVARADDDRGPRCAGRA